MLHSHSEFLEDYKTRYSVWPSITSVTVMHFSIWRHSVSQNHTRTWPIHLSIYFNYYHYNSYCTCCWVPLLLLIVWLLLWLLLPLLLLLLLLLHHLYNQHYALHQPLEFNIQPSELISWTPCNCKVYYKRSPSDTILPSDTWILNPC